MQQVINLIIADDHNLFLDGLKQLFKDEENIAVIDIANNGKELLEIVGKQSTDIILLDINMPGMNGLDAIKFIKKSHPQIKIIILSTYNDDHLVEKAKILGANGYLLKTANKDELLETIQLVHKGQACFPYRLPKTSNGFDEPDIFLSQFNLTLREKDILQHIKAGLTNQQIADKLFLSVYTVDTHRKNIMHKLSLRNPAQLMKFIIENNLGSEP